jgi:hypothetical protein
VAQVVLGRGDLFGVSEQVPARRHDRAEARAEPMLGEKLGCPARVPVAGILDLELDHVEAEVADPRCKASESLVGERRDPNPRVCAERIHRFGYCSANGSTPR